MRKMTVLGAAALAVLLAAPARAEMTRAEVEKIVREYIANNAQDILDSVQAHQEKEARAQQAAAVKDNRLAIYHDPLTPTIGNEEGDVTVVEFFDYNCGYCKKVTPDLVKLVEGDKKVRVLFKDYPILSATSETAAKWALAAHKQKKYFEFHRLLMENRAPIDDALLEDVARRAGLDVDRAKRDAESADILMQIERNRSLAASMGIRGTPAFLVGEEIAPGAIGLAEMKKMVEKARKK